MLQKPLSIVHHASAQKDFHSLNGSSVKKVSNKPNFKR